MKIPLVLAIVTINFNINSIDLYTSYQKALSYNASYLSAIAQNLAANEYPQIAASALLPQISLSGTLNENYYNQGGMEAYYHQPIYTLSLNQTVLDLGKFSNYIKAEYGEELANLQLENAKQQLMIQVAQAYFDVLYAQDALLATQMTKYALKEQMAQANAAFKLGSVTIADVNDAKAAYDAAEADEIGKTNDLIYKQNIFKNITGINPILIEPLANQINLSPTLKSRVTWAEIASKANLNILVAHTQVDMAREDIKIAKSAHYPTLNLSFNYQYQDTGNIDTINSSSSTLQTINYPGGPLSNYTTASVMLTLSVPIYTGGLINAQTRQAMDNYESSEAQVLNVSRTTEQNINNAYWQVENGVNLVKAQKSALLSAKTKLDSDKLGYQVGVRNSIDLVSSQKNYYQAFQSYKQSEYQFLMAKINLRYLSGLINANYIALINQNIKH